MEIIGDALRQAFMPKHEYETLRDEEKAWGRIQKPLVTATAVLVSIAVVISVLISMTIVFPGDRGRRPFCKDRTGHQVGMIPANARRDSEAFRYHGAFYLTDEEAADYYWMVVLVPSAIVFVASVVYLLAGMAVAYSAPKRHMCLVTVENNYCASKRGGVRCLSILNIVFAVIFGLLALFLGSSLLTLGSDCSIPLFWCYEVASWGLVTLYSGTAFSYLSLNVSREILQESRMVRIMRKRLVRKTFDMIDEISKSEDKEDYKKFWDNFGKLIKLGCIEDSGNHKRLAPLLRFYSSKSGEEMIGLDSYIENMSENQKVIFYLATDSLKSAKSAPFMEKLTQKDIEVLYLVDPIDEVSIQNLQTYKEKKFVDISKEDLELGDEDEVKERENQQECNLLCDWMKQQLGEKVAKVQISKRLSSSPCVLVSGKFGWSANMERLMKAQTLGDTSSMEFMRGRRILEINPDHPIIKDLNAACKNDPSSSDAQRAVDLLYDTALISSGFTPDSPAELGGKIFEMMAIALGGRWGRSEVDSLESNSEADVSSEVEVIEPSEVRVENNDHWAD